MKPQGPPKLADALSAFVANARVVEHYISWAETMAEFKATVLSRDARLAAETYKGAQKYSKFSRSVQAIETDGVKQAVMQNEVGALFSRWMNANSKTALLGRMALVFKQIPAAMASAAKVGAVDFAKSSARVLSGNGAVTLKEMWNSGIIQRRLQKDGDLARQLAMGSRADVGVVAYAEGKNWEAVGFADAGFTLWSATAAFDAAYNDALAAGMDEAGARADAWTRAEMIVEQTAQPQTTSSKSLMEIEFGMWARVFFAFQGPTRPLWAAMYEAAKAGNAGKAIDVYLAAGVLIPVFAHTMNNLIRAAIDDEDDLEDLFTLKSYTTAVRVAPAQGMLIFGPIAEYLGKGNGVSPRLASIPVQESIAAIKAAVIRFEKGKEMSEAQMAHFIKASANLIGGKAAAAGVAVNIWKEITGLLGNFGEQPPEKPVKKK